MNRDWQLITETIGRECSSSPDSTLNDNNWEIVQVQPSPEGGPLL